MRRAQDPARRAGYVRAARRISLRGALDFLRGARGDFSAHVLARAVFLAEERSLLFMGRLGRASALMGFNGPRGGPSPLGFFQIFWVFRKRPTTLAPQVRGSGVPGR